MAAAESGALPIVACHSPSFQEWSELCAQSREATPFHTPHWARAVSAAFPQLRTATRVYQFADGARLVMPMQESGPPGGLCRRVSVEPGVYGGPIGDCIVTDARLNSLAAYLAPRSPGGCAVVGNQFAAWRIAAASGFKPTPLITHILRLEGGIEGVGRQTTKGHRCNVKQAARLGVTVVPAVGPDDVAAYYAVYQDSVRRWGERARGNPYPERLFHALLAGGDSFARLWLARVSGEVVSGALVLSWGEGAVYWHGATLERAFAWRPSHAVVMTAIEDAVSRGCRWFDFNPSGGLEGVIRFKEGFGARPVLCHTWELPARPAARLAQRVVRRLSGSP
jgi:hypothetical protein